VNWSIDGAARVLTEGFPKESLSSRRVEKLLLESNSIVGFLGTAIEKSDSGPGITINELVREYVRWCQSNEWEPLLDAEGKRKLKQGLETRFHVNEVHSLKRTDSSGNERDERGFNGVRFKEPDNQ
jgi:phage/plasmid-associated DNA primase